MKSCPECGHEIAGSAGVCDTCHPAPADEPAHPLLSAVPLEQSADDGPDLDLVDEVPAPADVTAETPAEVLAAAQSPETGFSSREIAMVLLALVGTGALTTLLLMSRGVASPEAAAAVPALTTPRPANTPAPVAPDAAPAVSKWKTSTSGKWLGNARRSFAAELQADAPVPIWTRTVRPVLVVRCMGSSPEVFVFTDSQAKIEPRTDDHTVTLTFDDGQAQTERWPDSADHDALFAPNGRALIDQLTRARTLRFGFTPHNAPPVTADFQVDGLAPALARARECSQKK
jgi:hypothetical protein